MTPTQALRVLESLVSDYMADGDPQDIAEECISALWDHVLLGGE